MRITHVMCNSDLRMVRYVKSSEPILGDKQLYVLNYINIKITR